MKTGAHRNHPHYWAFVLHRVSGLLLALFLPVHFYVLGLAIEGAATLDGFLDWSSTPLAKLGETALVILLAAHLTGGLRLMALEFLGTRESSKTAVAVATGIAICTGMAFALNGT